MAGVNITMKQVGPTAMESQISEIRIITDRPVEKGGGGKGLMGGQHLVMGVGGCFSSTFFAAAQARNISIEGLTISLFAKLSEDLPKRFTDITIEAQVEKCSHPEELNKLLKIAEEGCISINSVKNGISIFVT